MKILLISHLWHTNSNHSRSSGYERLAFHLSKNNRVDLLTCGDRNQDLKINKNFNLLIRKTPKTNFLFEKRISLSYHTLKLKGNYDIAHSLYSDNALFTSFKFPTIITCHILKEVNPRSIWLNYKWILQKIILKKIKFAITVSNNLKKILEKKYGLKNKVIYIPHGIDTKVFFPRKMTKKLITKKNRLLGKRRYLCFSCGSHGVDSKTFLMVAKQFPNILFIVTGRKEKTNLKNVINTGNISEEKLIEFYLLADFCFKPLKFATANNGILEAMAMGKAIITNKIDGVTDYLDNSCGFLAKSTDDFMGIFNNAITKKNIDKLGRNARKKVQKEFSWEIISEKMVNVYSNVLSNS